MSFFPLHIKTYMLNKSKNKGTVGDLTNLYVFYLLVHIVGPRSDSTLGDFDSKYADWVLKASVMSTW